MLKSKRRKTPLQDAEDHMTRRADKPGLQEQFISKYKGRGVFTTRAFFRRDFVLEYRGELLSSEESLDRTEHYTEAENAFLFDFQWRGRNWCMDASKEDCSLGRLVNDEHRNPTCKMRTLEVSRKPHLCLFAVRDILPGEEITFNHGYSDWPWRVKPLNQASTESSDKKPSISLGPQRSPHCAAPVSSPGLDEVNSSGPHKQSGKARTSRKTKRFQSRLAKLRKHHEDSYERFNRAEIENERNKIAKQLSQKDCLSSLVASATDASSSSAPCAVSTSVMTSSPSPYYRLPEGTLQLAKMSKVLIAMEKGTLSDFKGKKLDDIEIDPNEQLEAQGDSMSSDEEDYSDVSQTAAPAETDPPVQSDQSGSQEDQGSSNAPKKKWEDNEVKAVERHMMKFIKTCKVPGKQVCERCIHAEPEALKQRTWTRVKNYVRNRITTLKRKGGL
ncbi:histone-lysine N-methyltransferase ash1-like isoform X1 [Megalobrama amblycephala]|uniref:histone-lysine N-methyltransferase ash1-like isoform X1 n=1 Tax=Megalobrama amblycephala TaxID=75352 RepID=UPI0020145DF4|nr:histone-lysine N-methyltransferase ash1-like isoform X1 [Megalobrama amblycephala]